LLAAQAKLAEDQSAFVIRQGTHGCVATMKMERERERESAVAGRSQTPHGNCSVLESSPEGLCGLLVTPSASY